MTRVLFFILALNCVLASAPAAGAPSLQQLVAALPAEDGTVRAFYQARGFAPAWNKDDAAILRGVLARAGAEGLDPGDYQTAGRGDGLAADLALTKAALVYVRDAREGRPALRRLDEDVALPESSYSAAAGLEGALRSHSLAAFLSLLPPPNPQYAALKAALVTYRGISSRGGWPTLPANATGKEGPPIPLLLQRLAIEDPALSADPHADPTAALKAFQARHGLDADGRLGKRTLAELNISASARADQIAANMERWRWMPRSLEADYIMVNIPDAQLALFLGGENVLTSRAIVGKPKTPTPILRAEGGGITINPPWNVPNSIARNEILPKLKANPAYLKSQDMVLLNGPAGDPYGLGVNWRGIPAGTFPYLIQQHPGAANPLGTIKLELPNRFDVYLHDTPGKGAFARASRDLSHGCVRVERILPLASYALTANPDAMITISDAVSSGATKYFPLERRLPVYFVYWTAFSDTAGVLQFRPDIYGRDARMIAARTAPLRISENFPNCSRG